MGLRQTEKVSQLSLIRVIEREERKRDFLSCEQICGRSAHILEGQTSTRISPLTSLKRGEKKGDRSTAV